MNEEKNIRDIKENFNSKNLIMIGIAVIVIITVIVICSLLYHTYFYKKSFGEIEDIMVDAAKSYYSKNTKMLPKDNGEIVNIKVDTLISGEYMKTIGEYLKNDEILCKGSVNVTNSNGKYRYVPLLDCGKNYKYEFMIDHVKNNSAIVDNGNGLYQNENSLVYRGEKVNNYVSFANSNWRIIKIEDDKIYLIYNDKLDKKVWDDRYNKDRDYYDGINDYKLSRIRDYLNSIYKNSTIFNSNDRLLLTTHNINVTKIGEEDNYKYGDKPEFANLDNQYVSLPNIYDYMNASLDGNCTYSTSSNCSNYNYIVNYDYNFWLNTVDKNTSHYVYIVSNGQGAYLTKASNEYYVRPVITITKDAIYVSGKGSKKSPYVFK